ncbi:MAG: C4-dicarboxylate ABC transporter substrate-binding protein [Paracoccaceae bacterium]
MRIPVLWAGAFALLATPTIADATEWRVSLWGKRRAFTEHVEHLARLVSQRTRGEFRIELFYGGLAPSRENLAGIADGRFEMAQFCAGYHPEKNRAITVLELPFIGTATLEEERAISESVYAHPAAVREMQQWNAKLLMPTPLPQYNLVGVGPRPDGLDWFDGKTIRATGGIGRALGELGSETRSLTATETYAALESGALDAVAFAQHAHFAFNTIALAEWWTANLNPGSVNCPVVVNIDAYEALPEAHRAALDAAVAPALDYYLLNYADLIGKWNVVLELFGVPVVALEPETKAAIIARTAEAARTAWLEDMAEAGLPGQELLDLVDDRLSVLQGGEGG